MSGTPAKPKPPVDCAQLMELHRQGRCWDDIGGALGLRGSRCKAFYIQMIRSNANKARRSQQQPGVAP